MAKWRIGKGWSNSEIATFLREADQLPYDHELDAPKFEKSLYSRICSDGVIAVETPGPPVASGSFETACAAVLRYYFSDPEIVVGYMSETLLKSGSSILIDMQAPLMHVMSATRVVSVRRIENANETQFGFRYDTLKGHIESGAEWFLLNKDHANGKISLRITAAMKPGQFPNFILHWGYLLTNKYYRRKWHRHSHDRLRKLVGYTGDHRVSIETEGCRLGYLDEPNN